MLLDQNNQHLYKDNSAQVQKLLVSNSKWQKDLLLAQFRWGQ